MKRRTLADMAPFELLLLVTLGDIIQQGITQEDYSVTGAVLAVSTFAFWITVLTYVTWRWRRAASVIDGVPLVIVQDGTLIERTLRAERLPIAEVLEAARQNGIESLDKVRLAVLETTGRISFIRPTTSPTRHLRIDAGGGPVRCRCSSLGIEPAFHDTEMVLPEAIRMVAADRRRPESSFPRVVFAQSCAKPHKPWPLGRLTGITAARTGRSRRHPRRDS